MDNIQFDEYGIEILSHEEQVKRAFQYPITYFGGTKNKEEIFQNPVNLAHMKMMLELRGKALSQVYHKIKVFIDGLQTLESTDSNIVLQYLENNAHELDLSRVEQIDLKYEA